MQFAVGLIIGISIAIVVNTAWYFWTRTDIEDMADTYEQLFREYRKEVDKELKELLSQR